MGFEHLRPILRGMAYRPRPKPWDLVDLIRFLGISPLAGSKPFNFMHVALAIAYSVEHCFPTWVQRYPRISSGSGHLCQSQALKN